MTRRGRPGRGFVISVGGFFCRRTARLALSLCRGGGFWGRGGVLRYTNSFAALAFQMAFLSPPLGVCVRNTHVIGIFMAPFISLSLNCSRVQVFYFYKKFKKGGGGFGGPLMYFCNNKLYSTKDVYYRLCAGSSSMLIWTRSLKKIANAQVHSGENGAQSTIKTRNAIT